MSGSTSISRDSLPSSRSSSHSRALARLTRLSWAVLVKLATAIQWHRKSFRLYWRDSVFQGSRKIANMKLGVRGIPGFSQEEESLRCVIIVCTTSRPDLPRLRTS
jgi:hypothetical protein